MAVIHTRLREFREAKGLSTRELARRLNTSSPTITRLETGKQTVSVEWLEKIGHILGVPPSAFLDDDLVFATLRGDLRPNRKEWPDFGVESKKFIPVPDLFGIKVRGSSLVAFQVEDHKLIFCDRGKCYDDTVIGIPHVLRIYLKEGGQLLLGDYYDDETSNPVFVYKQGYPYKAHVSLWDDAVHDVWRVIAEWRVLDTG